MTERDIQDKLRRTHQSAFVQFGRNGRWGTCVDCPRDANGEVYPEVCVNTDRYDHQLTLRGLVEGYEHSKKCFRGAA